MAHFTILFDFSNITERKFEKVELQSQPTTMYPDLIRFKFNFVLDPSDGLSKAEQHKNTLLEYDRTSEQRTKVI
jgi:hypothetical protein